jgi:hypothetical protein
MANKIKWSKVIDGIRVTIQDFEILSAEGKLDTREDVVVEKDNLRVVLPWDNDTPMIPCLVETVLDNIGIGKKGTETDLKVREATRNHCVKVIQGVNDLGEIFKHQWIEEEASAYSQGYEDCLKDQLPREPRLTGPSAPGKGQVR